MDNKNCAIEDEKLKDVNGGTKKCLEEKGRNFLKECDLYTDTRTDCEHGRCIECVHYHGVDVEKKAMIDGETTKNR